MRSTLLACLLLFSTRLFAQTAPSTIDGRITGQINGQIPGLPVTPTAPPATAQAGGYRLIPLTPKPLSPGTLTLLELEGRFQQAVVEGGGKAFSTFFADDAVILSNGQPALQGRGAIATQAQWDPKTYQLTWNPEGAQMGPSGDMGFTWGHYDGRLIDPSKPAAPPALTSGRYFTVWKKPKDGAWKVAMDASAQEPPSSSAAACCTVPHP